MQAAEGEEKIWGWVDGGFFMWGGIAAGGGCCSGIRFLQETQTAISKSWRGKNFLAARISENAVCCFSESAAAAELRIVC
jgi:hypothetical protein